MTNWHQWTPDQIEIIRRDFTGTKESIRRIADHLSYEFGEEITPAMVTHQVNKLGIAGIWERAVRGPEWTVREDEQLRERVSRGQDWEMIGKALGRSATAVMVRSKRIGAYRWARTGWYTKKDLMEILGVDHKRIQRWIDEGELKARPYNVDPQQAGGGYWIIQEEDLRNFLVNHSMELTGRNVDLYSIVNLFQSSGRHYPGPENNPFNNPGKNKYKIKKIGEHWDGREKVWIWLVDGKKIRDNRFIVDFTQGGHHYVYNRIPENEIWIDDCNYAERYPVVAHEAYERKQMKFKRKSYSKAHVMANREEKAFRTNPSSDDLIDKVVTHLTDKIADGTVRSGKVIGALLMYYNDPGKGDLLKAYTGSNYINEVRRTKELIVYLDNCGLSKSAIIEVLRALYFSIMKVTKEMGYE